MIMRVAIFTDNDFDKINGVTTTLTAVLEHAREMGLLLGKGGLYGNVIRIKPPMCISKADCDFLADCLDECLTEAGGGG